MSLCGLLTATKKKKYYNKIKTGEKVSVTNVCMSRVFSGSEKLNRNGCCEKIMAITFNLFPLELQLAKTSIRRNSN